MGGDKTGPGLRMSRGLIVHHWPNVVRWCEFERGHIVVFEFVAASVVEEFALVVDDGHARGSPIAIHIHSMEDSR